MDVEKHISVNPNICHGKPCIKGTRVPVFVVLESLAAGMSYQEINEDLLRELYQELVDPQTRHDLGEFYTPDWLAELTLREAGFGPEKSLLDPACGSGTFLFTALRILARQGLSGGALTEQALEKITGLDVHPLAITIARANYALALTPHLQGYGKAVTIPIYMADSLWKPKMEIPVSETEAFHIPPEIARTPQALNEALDGLAYYARLKPEDYGLEGNFEAFKENFWQEGFRSYLRKRDITEGWTYWAHNLRLMRQLVKEGRDTIWAFILKNVSRPALLAHVGFDLVVGNPPWLAYRYIKHARYQQQVKSLTLAYNLLPSYEVKLFTQMDTSTLFFEHCARLYLKPEGVIAFVMPKSVLTGAKQHARFQALGFHRAIDLEGVEPLFNVPACVLVRRAGEKLPVATPLLRLSGRLPGKFLDWAEAEGHLAAEETTLALPHYVGKQSPYYERFLQGATLVPRCFWFVRPAPIKDRGVISLSRPYLESHPDVERQAKEPWQGLRLSGPVESDFLYATLLSTHLLPFGYRKLSLVVLPLTSGEEGSELITPMEALSFGSHGLADWLRQAKREWDDRRKTTTERSIYQRLDYHRTLTSQHPAGCYKVIYNRAGTNLAACVIDATQPETLYAEDLPVKGFVAESVTYIYETESEEEAQYLCAVLNSSVVNEAIKPHQTRGLWGERDITRRPFEVVPIPLFYAENRTHRGLAEISRECHKKVATMGKEELKGSIGRARGKVRLALAEELAKIDKLVRELLEWR